MEISESIEVEECPDVYPPSEDSYLLIRSLDGLRGKRVLEIGCGSGIVSLHIASAGADVTACDIDPAAVECTRRNAERNGVALDVRVSDLFSGVEGRYDLVVFNLPYLPTDDGIPMSNAWDGGPTGLGPLERLLDGLPGRLNPGGSLVVVVSSLSDADALDEITKGFRTERLASEKLFFEEISVLRIAPGTS